MAIMVVLIFLTLASHYVICRYRLYLYYSLMHYISSQLITYSCLLLLFLPKLWWLKTKLFKTSCCNERWHYGFRIVLNQPQTFRIVLSQPQTFKNCVCEKYSIQCMCPQWEISIFPYTQFLYCCKYYTILWLTLWFCINTLYHEKPENHSNVMSEATISWFIGWFLHISM